MQIFNTLTRQKEEFVPSTSVCRSKPVTGPPHRDTDFPRCAVRAHFTRRFANRLSANGLFSLRRRFSHYSARINAFFLINLL